MTDLVLVLQVGDHLRSTWQSPNQSTTVRANNLRRWWNLYCGFFDVVDQQVDVSVDGICLWTFAEKFVADECVVEENVS
jgi:hypothetical protein